MLGDRIRAAIGASADWVQIREKDLGAQALLKLARDSVEAGSFVKSRVLVIVNDRLDVALASGAAGVHLGGESAPVRELAEWARRSKNREDFLVGVSCHTLAEARAAAEAEASYVFFGPVFDTPSKRSFGSPQGVDRLAEVCRSVDIPVFAIGGINFGNARDCLAAGASGIAAIRMFQGVEDRTKLRTELERLRDFGR